MPNSLGTVRESRARMEAAPPGRQLLRLPSPGFRSPARGWASRLEFAGRVGLMGTIGYIDGSGFAD